MKFTVAALLVAQAVAFAPSAKFGVQRTALSMSTETESSETKVRKRDGVER